ncbi:MAG: hypothetical protein ACXU86_18890 [Archangium sp.]
MGKLITFILALAVIAGAAWYSLHHAAEHTAASGEASAPKQQLDNVRQSVRRIESDADKRAEDLQGKMQDGQ